MIEENNNEFNPNIKEVIVKNIRRIRKLKGFTQEELAYKADISYDFMRRIESGHGNVGFSIQTFYKLSVALEVSLDDLIKE